MFFDFQFDYDRERWHRREASLSFCFGWMGFFITIVVFWPWWRLVLWQNSEDKSLLKRDLVTKERSSFCLITVNELRTWLDWIWKRWLTHFFLILNGIFLLYIQSSEGVRNVETSASLGKIRGLVMPALTEVPGWYLFLWKQILVLETQRRVKLGLDVWLGQTSILLLIPNIWNCQGWAYCEVTSVVWNLKKPPPKHINCFIWSSRQAEMLASTKKLDQ